MSRERVIIRSGRLRLVGELYLPAGDGPWPGLALCHGLASRKERHADFAAFAASRGFAALAYDARGHGESEGKLDGRPLEDVSAVLDYLAARPEVDAGRLAVRGSSLGGNLAIHATAELPAVRACVAICPAPEELLLAELRRVAAEGLDSLDLRLDALDFANYLRGHNLSRAVALIAPRPLLLVHCLGDEVVPAAGTSELFKAAGEPKELWLLPGGSHTSAQHDPAIHERVVAWLDRQLTP